MRFDLDVNGSHRTVDTEPERPLLDVLREELDLTGTKYGCGEGACRACTVLVDGRAVPSCRMPVERARGRRIVTIEGLAIAAGQTAGSESLHPVQRAFVEAGAMQCGYCVPGMVLTTVALLAENPRPTRQEAIEALDGNLCRCCGYVRILAAVERLAEGAPEPSAAAQEVKP